MSAKRDEILAAFPGPVTLYPNMLKWGALSVILLLCAALPIYGLFFADTPLTPKWLALHGFLLICLIVLPAYLLVVMVSGNYKLTLDRDGFNYQFGVFHRMCRWVDVVDFESSSIGYGTSIFYSDVGDTLARSVWKMLRGSNFITVTFGLSAVDLAAVLNTWRERAVGLVDDGARDQR
jgi:hypothetical protein